MKTFNIIGFALSVILILSISVWMPVIGPFFSLIMPLPFIFFFCKLEAKEGLTDGVIILFAVWILGKVTAQPYLFLFCLEFGIVGLVISQLFRRRLSIGATVLMGTAVMLMVGAIFLFLAGISEGKGPVDMILGYLQTGLDQTATIYEQSGIEQENLEQIRQALAFLGRLIARIYPALIIISTGLVVWINVVLSRPIFRMGGIAYPSFGDPGRWRAPEILVWGIILSGFALFLPSTGIRFIAENLLIVLAVIYVFHGLSILIFFFNRHRIPVWARTGIYILILIQQIFLIVLAFVGLFDQWADFRKIHKKMEEIQ